MDSQSINMNIHISLTLTKLEGCHRNAAATHLSLIGLDRRVIINKITLTK